MFPPPQFDGILDNAPQDAVYNATAAEMVSAAMDGINGTLFCYGQTGAGKTFTMSGDLRNYNFRGVIPRAIHQARRWTARIDCSGAASTVTGPKSGVAPRLLICALAVPRLPSARQLSPSSKSMKTSPLNEMSLLLNESNNADGNDGHPTLVHRPPVTCRRCSARST